MKRLLCIVLAAISIMLFAAEPYRHNSGGNRAQGRGQSSAQKARKAGLYAKDAGGNGAGASRPSRARPRIRETSAQGTPQNREGGRRKGAPEDEKRPSQRHDVRNAQEKPGRTLDAPQAVNSARYINSGKKEKNFLKQKNVIHNPKSKEK